MQGDFRLNIKNTYLPTQKLGNHFFARRGPHSISRKKNDIAEFDEIKMEETTSS